MAQAILPGSFAVPAVSVLPPKLRRYAATGTPPSTVVRDLVTVSNQIPRWAYAVVALGAGWIAYRSWSSERKPKRDAKPEKLTE